MKIFYYSLLNLSSLIFLFREKFDTLLTEFEFDFLLAEFENDEDLELALKANGQKLEERELKVEKTVLLLKNKK